MRVGEEQRFLRAVWARLPTEPCSGCTDCAARCAGGLQMTRTEFEAIRTYLGAGGWFPRVRRQAQMAAPCEFQREDAPWCLIYPVRPLICRLFGLVVWLPCPTGRVPVLVADGPEIMRAYAAFDRRTYREWLRVVAKE
ncbi:MAG: YkgJ family cysteine cluster protein [Armatimonadota bacterium]